MAKKKTKRRFSLFVHGKFDYALFIATIILVGIGLMMLLSASSPTSISETGSSTKYLIRQARYAALGFFFMMAFAKVDCRIYKNSFITALIYLACIGFLVLVAVAGTAENGAKRWINIGRIFLFPTIRIC